MSTSYEQTLLAIAIKNNLITKGQALNCLKELRESSVPANIDSILLTKKLLTHDQLKAIKEKTIQLLTKQQDKSTQEVIPGYKITGKLGTGGTATVFVAKGSDGKQVALKILHPAKAKDQNIKERFIKEAGLLKEFSHSNLLKALSYGDYNNLIYSVLEYIDGPTVQNLIDKDGKLPEAQALEIILQVAKALEYIRSMGYVHKDIKPSNIMISKDLNVKLCDLGFADPIANTIDELTQKNDEYTVGTVEFMSPEQAQGKRDIDIRSDIYSLGATLYYMVLGKPPFTGTTDLEVMAKHVLEDINSAEIKNKRISQHMHYFIERMMSKDKDLRYLGPAELIKDITEQIDGFKQLQFDESIDKKDTRIIRSLTGRVKMQMEKEFKQKKETTTKFIKPSDPVKPTSRRFTKLDQITARLKRRDIRK